MYHALKSTLWDLFPAWEDQAVDAAFREMLWASRGGDSAAWVGCTYVAHACVAPSAMLGMAALLLEFPANGLAPRAWTCIAAVPD